MRRIMWYTKSMLWLAILLAGLLSACVPITPTPTATPAATATPGLLVSEEKLAEIRDECQARSAMSLEEQAKIPEGEDLVYPPFQGLIYVENQVVITGPPARIDAVTDALEVGLELMDGISLEYLARDKEMQGADLETLSQQLGMLQQGLRRSPTYVAGLDEDSDPRHFPTDLESLSEMAIQLYQIPEDKTAVQLTCEINGVSAQAGEAVFSDPNYHLSPAADWNGGGSPWTQNGQWAEMLPGGGLGHAPASEFLSQWALKPAGIELVDGNGSRQTEYMGNNIRVGVFDTSPFPDQSGAGPHVLQFPFRGLMGMVVGQSASAEPPLTVWHYDQVPAPTCPGPDRKDPNLDREKQDLSNHGLFVSGLVHAVAPHSEIYLVRVLEDDGCGNLYSIAKGLHMFIDDTLQDRGGTLRGTVMNLSLGVHRPADATEKFKLPEEVVTLQSAVRTALGLGAVVVAAAGNDSYDPAADPESMEIPADEPGVLGVAATNVSRGRGCFSNAGDIAAPGGDGDAPCEVPKCDSDHPEACIVSVIRKPNPGYAYWVGTSFATPLVSGLAALVLEQGGGTVFGMNVHNEIEVNACPAPPPTPSDPHLGAGIIHVPHTLSGAPCPIP